MGLVPAGGQFLALYTKTTGDLANRTDVYLARGDGTALAKSGERSWIAEPAAPFTVGGEWQARLDEAARAAVARRARPPR
jgi:hypothetical protein